MEITEKAKQRFSLSEIQNAVGRINDDVLKVDVSSSRNMKLYTSDCMHVYNKAGKCLGWTVLDEKEIEKVFSSSRLPLMENDVICEICKAVITDINASCAWGNITSFHTELEQERSLQYRMHIRASKSDTDKILKLNETMLRDRDQLSSAIRSSVSSLLLKTLQQWLTKNSETVMETVFGKRVLSKFEKSADKQRFSSPTSKFLKNFHMLSGVTLDEDNTAALFYYGTKNSHIDVSMDLHTGKCRIESTLKYNNVLSEIDACKTYEATLKKLEAFEQYCADADIKASALKPVTASLTDKDCDHLSYLLSCSQYDLDIRSEVDIPLDRISKKILFTPKGLCNLADGIKESLRKAVNQKIMQLEKAGLVDNVLSEAIADVIQQNSGWITENRINGILRGRTVPDDIKIDKKWYGKFPLLPEECVSSMLKKMYGEHIINAHWHRNDYHVEYETFSIREDIAKLLKKEQTDLSQWEEHDGSVMWIRYLEDCRDGKIQTDEEWETFLYIAEKPIICCYCHEVIEQAMLNAPEHVLLFYEYASLERYASYLKKTAKSVRKDRKC